MFFSAFWGLPMGLTRYKVFITKRTTRNFDMARRDHDFTASQKTAIKDYFGNVCAACGDSNSRNLQADHFISGNAADEGICLCHYCNVNIKGTICIPEKFRLIPRDAVKIDENYITNIQKNQDAFAAWVSQFRFFQAGKSYNLKKIKFFEAPV